MDEGEDLVARLWGTLDELLIRGYEPPFHMATLGCNGEGFTVTYAQDGEGLNAVLTSRVAEHGTLDYPINILIVDSRGQARLVLIQDPNGEPEVVH